MNILYLISYAGKAGTEKYVENLMRTFFAQGHRCFLAYMDGGGLPEKLAALRPKRRGDLSRLLTVYREMEPLTERYPRMLAALDRCPPLPDEIEAERILQYFLYKYLLQAAYDGKLLKKYWRR